MLYYLIASTPTRGPKLLSVIYKNRVDSRA